MEFISNEKVEEIAAELFKYYKETLNENQDILYIEPLVLAEMLGYDVILLEFGEDSDVLGLTVFRDMDVTLVDMYGKNHRLHLTNKSIVVNKSLREVCFGRYKFTIAHELAHHIIDERFNAEYSVKYRKLPHFAMDSPQVHPVSYDEVIANRLAAAILIPIDILKNSFTNVFGETYVEKIISKTIIMSGDDSASYGQNAYFYDSAEGLLTSAILLLAEFGGKGERHIVSVYKLIQELLEPSRSVKKNKFQTLVNELPEDHKAKWFAGAALTTSDTTMASVMSTALSRLNAFLDSELEQLLCFDTEIDAEKFCNEKSAIFVVMPEEDPNKIPNSDREKGAGKAKQCANAKQGVLRQVKKR